MQVIVNNLLANYTQAGRGKVVICLHGWGDDSKTFEGLASHLTNRYKVLALDLPGFGGSQSPLEAWGLEDYALFISTWLKKIDTGRVYAIIGHSFGGAIAVAGIGSGILEAQKLVLLASSGVRTKRNIRKRVLWLGAKGAKVPLYLLPADRARKVKTFLYHKAGSDVMLHPQMRQTFVKTVDEDIQAAARKITVPTLLIYGSHDKETPLKDGQMLHAAIQRSQLSIIAGAGHWLHHQRLPEITKLIDKFINS